MKKCWFCTQNSQNWLIFDLKSTELSHNIYFIYIERSAQTDLCNQKVKLEARIYTFLIFMDAKISRNSNNFVFVGRQKYKTTPTKKNTVAKLKKYSALP